MRGAAQLDDRRRQISSQPVTEQPSEQEYGQKTSSNYPQTERKRSRFSQMRRRPGKIRLRQLTGQNISEALWSPYQMSCDRALLLREKIKYVRRVFGNAAKRVQYSLGNRSTRDFI